jgi:hypothetical protein
MLGAGKYDDICSEIRNKTNAVGTILIVVNGNRGSGFSCQMPYEELAKLPDVLIDVAESIKQDIKKIRTESN